VKSPSTVGESTNQTEEQKEEHKTSLRSVHAREGAAIAINLKHASTFGQVRSIWNKHLKGKAAEIIHRFTPERQKTIPLFLAEICDPAYDEQLGNGDVFSRFDTLCQIIGQCSYLHGSNGRRGFRIGIDWVAKPGNVTKIAEGAYADGGSSLDILKRLELGAERYAAGAAEREEKARLQAAEHERKLRHYAEKYAERHLKWGEPLGEKRVVGDPNGVFFDLALAQAAVARMARAAQ